MNREKQQKRKGKGQQNCYVVAAAEATDLSSIAVSESNSVAAVEINHTFSAAG
jgi:hypothetical protein